jgi:spermidine synthase
MQKKGQRNHPGLTERRQGADQAHGWPLAAQDRAEPIRRDPGGDPGAVQPEANRFFTEAFFSLAKDRLNPGGILVLGLPGSLTYASDALKDLNSCIFNTLNQVFSNVRVIPGERRNLLLSSDSRDILTMDRDRIIHRLDRRGIQAEVLLPWRIEQKLHPGWQAWFSHFTEGGSQKINADFKPLGVFYSIAHWNALLAPQLLGLFSQLERVSLRSVAVYLLALLLLYFLLRCRPVQFSRVGIPWAIITTGFSGMIFDLMLIFAFQATYGYVFSWIGLLVASFMAGVASPVSCYPWASGHRGRVRFFQGPISRRFDHLRASGGC